MKIIFGLFISMQIVFGALESIEADNPTSTDLVLFDPNKAEESKEVVNNCAASTLGSIISYFYAPFKCVSKAFDSLTNSLGEIGEDPFDANWDYFLGEKNQKIASIPSKQHYVSHVNSPLPFIYFYICGVLLDKRGYVVTMTLTPVLK